MTAPWLPATDAAFVALFDLNHADLRDAKPLSAKGEHAAAARAIVETLGAKPLQSYLGQQEAAELGKQIAADDSQAIPTQLRFVAALDEHLAGHKHYALANREAWLHAVDFGHDAHFAICRGRAWHYFGHLHALTGERRWADRAGALIDQLDSLQALPEDEAQHVPVLPWHPNCPAVDGLGIAHIVQKAGVTLPLLWPGWDAATRRKAAEYLAHQAEGFYRAYREDPLYNIPFHGLVAMLGVAALFPQLRGAKKWKAHFEKLVGPGGVAVTPWIMAQEGFYGEGLGYQQDNLFLLTRALLLLDRGFPGGQAPRELRHEVELGYKLSADTLRPDGNAFLIGDHTARTAHEHEIEHHEILHLGAALFDRPEWKARAGGLRGVIPPILDRFLMGRDGYARWKNMPAPDLRGRTHVSAAHAVSGFFHLRAGRGVQDACHGLLNVSICSNHGHHDVGSVCIYGLGRELISDSGRLSYTAEGNALQQAPAAHAMLRLGHLMPRGPRHATAHAATRKLFAQSPDSRIQVALGEHTLVEDHVQRRALILVLPYGPERGEGLWLVWDRLAHAGSRDGQEPSVGTALPAPQRVLETTFPLHAPGGSAKVDGLSAWSLHKPDDRLRARGKNETLALTSADRAFVEEAGESDANIQVSALSELPAGATMDCAVQDGFFSMTDLTCVRPVLSFQHRAFLPHEAAYALLPFRGLADTAPWSVRGWCGSQNRAGAFEARITAHTADLKARWKDEMVVRGEGLHGGQGAKARVTLLVGGKEMGTCELGLA